MNQLPILHRPLTIAVRHVCTFVYWIGRPDRSPLHSLKCFVDGMWRLCQFVKTSNESPEKGLPCIQLRVREQRRHSRAICVLHVVGISIGFFSFCFLFLFICSFPSVFLHGWTQFHTFGIVPLRPLKNGDRCLFSYGRVRTTVRTRRYDGSRSSVRSQSPVLSTATMGATDGLFALETV